MNGPQREEKCDKLSCVYTNGLFVQKEEQVPRVETRRESAFRCYLKKENELAREPRRVSRDLGGKPGKFNDR